MMLLLASFRQAFRRAQRQPSLLSRIADDASSLLRSRRGPRWALRAPAAISYHDTDGSEKTVQGQVRDLGAAGVSLRCEQPLPVGAIGRIVVYAEDSQYQADVSVLDSRQEFVRAFRVGCEFSFE